MKIETKLQLRANEFNFIFIRYFLSNLIERHSLPIYKYSSKKTASSPSIEMFFRFNPSNRKIS